LTAWTIGWSTWILSAVSLVGFYAWWGSRLDDVGQTFLSASSRMKIAVAAVIITAFGMVCDFSGEGSAIILLIDLFANHVGTPDLAVVEHVERAFTLLSAGAANGLYTVGGIMLTLITPGLPKWIRAAMWVTWIAAAGMTICALPNFVPGLVLTTAALFPPFLVWVAWMGARLPASSAAERSPS
jgi:hypothetical protein